MAIFSTPAFVDDLSASAKESWSDIVHGWFQSAEERLPAGKRLFNIADEDATGAVPALIPWDGFPRKLKLLYPTDVEKRWRISEEVVSQDLYGREARYLLRRGDGYVNARLPFRDQDEYCEWHTTRDAETGKPTRITFTCENPEYWTHLANSDDSRLLNLYRELIGPQVQRDDLFFADDIYVKAFNDQGDTFEVNVKGQYNPLNRWNTQDGVAHLTHPANSLSAEIFLAGDATVLRHNVDRTPVTDQAALICCAAYGGVTRSSDPTIGGRINNLVRDGLAVSIADPVGLYIGDIDSQPIELPGGLTFADCWTIIRGSAEDKMILRAEFALPEGSEFALEDVLVGGEPLRFGAQLAELITVVIHGIGLSRSDEAPSKECVAHCCAYSNVPALQYLKALDKTCEPRDLALHPSVSPAQAEAGDGKETILSMDELPDPRVR